MRTTRFYLPQALAPNTKVELTVEASHHAFTVLRLKEGDPLIVFNGEGGEYTATIVSTSKKSVVIRTGTFNSLNNESPLHIHLAIGISKGERFDFVLQKATELGATEITPLFTERTEAKRDPERQEKIQRRWQNILINACEQSQRNLLPKLNFPTDLSTCLNDEKSEKKIILHHHVRRNSQQMLDKNTKYKSVCLMVGPEGGFSDAEFQLAMQQGFAALALGPRVLRTETAPLAAISIVQLLWGDFS